MIEYFNENNDNINNKYKYSITINRGVMVIVIGNGYDDTS